MIERDLVGQKFGQLTVIGAATRDPKTRNRRWLCCCTCGNTRAHWESGLLRKHNTSCGSECLQKRNADAARDQTFDSYKRGALRRAQVWGLSINDFIELTKQRCFYCCAEPSNVAKTRGGNEFIYSGIDRLQNQSGYIVENCVPCCRVCNYMKRTMGADEFLGHVRRIVLIDDRRHMQRNKYDEFGNCTRCGGGEEGSIEHMVWCPVEGANPPIYCGESIPKSEVTNEGVHQMPN